MRDKALFITSGWLGDFVWHVPLIRGLTKKFNLDLVVSEQQEGLARGFEDVGLVGKVYVAKKKGRLKNALEIADLARKQGTKIYIDMVGKFKTGIYIPHMSDSDVFIPSREDAKEYPLAKMLHPFAKTMDSREKGHAVDSYMSVLDFFGIPRVADFKLGYSAAVRQEAEGVIRKNGLDRNFVALNIGSAQFSKIWPVENFLELGKRLRDQGLGVAFIGAGNFRWNGDYDRKIEKTCLKNDKYVFIESNSLMVNSCLLSSGVFDVSVGNDSFAGHVAGSANQVFEEFVGTRRASDGRLFFANYSVSLFGPTNSSLYAPYDPTGWFNLVVKPGEYACGYDPGKKNICSMYDKYPRGGRSACMSSISVDSVVDAVNIQLAKRGL